MKTVLSILCICIVCLSAFPAAEAASNPPIKITCERLASAEPIPARGQDYIVQGTVEDVLNDQIDPDHVFLILYDKGFSVPISLNHAKSDYSRLRTLIGAQVCVRGYILDPIVITGRFHRELTLDVRSTEAITVLKPAPDPFLVPDLPTDRPIGPRELAVSGRRRIRGHVLAAWQDRNVLMRSSEGQIVGVVLSEAGRPSAGDFIEAVGFPETDLYRINLVRAIWRPTAPFPVDGESTVDASSSDILASAEYNGLLNFRLHGAAIRISGSVLAISTPPNGETLLHLKNESQIILVHAAFGGPLPYGLEVGCTAEVTGRCVMSIANWQPRAPFPTYKGFEIVVNAPDGLRVTKRVPWWTPAHLLLVIISLFAILVAIVIWNFLLRRLAERRGRELLRRQIESVKSQLQVEERTRLAVELHDSLSQTLTGVSMEIAAADNLKHEESSEMATHLERAGRTLKSCRDELRNCLWDLRSEALDEPDMTTAVLRTLQPHVDGPQLSVRFNVPRARVSDNTAHAILRMIRELVVNALRHGRATSVKVAGSLDADGLHFSVRDNGRGFDPDTRPGVLQGHFGLQGIYERIQKLGGSLTIDSAPGLGARITGRIPTHTPTGVGV